MTIANILLGLTTDDDVILVQRMVKSYMEDKRTMCVALEQYGVR